VETLDNILDYYFKIYYQNVFEYFLTSGKIKNYARAQSGPDSDKKPGPKYWQQLTLAPHRGATIIGD
jgi:hypothetical protein